MQVIESINHVKVARKRRIENHLLFFIRMNFSYFFLLLLLILFPFFFSRVPIPIQASMQSATKWIFLTVELDWLIRQTFLD